LPKISSEDDGKIGGAPISRAQQLRPLRTKV
jgi:hypothetical protein